MQHVICLFECPESEMSWRYRKSWRHSWWRGDDDYFNGGRERMTSAKRKKQAVWKTALDYLPNLDDEFIELLPLLGMTPRVVESGTWCRDLFLSNVGGIGKFSLSHFGSTWLAKNLSCMCTFFTFIAVVVTAFLFVRKQSRWWRTRQRSLSGIASWRDSRPALLQGHRKSCWQNA